MTIRRISSDFKIPLDVDALESGDPKRITAYMSELADFLQLFLANIIEVANLVIDLADGDAIYSKPQNIDGSYPLGTWRLKQVDDNWERQVQQTLGVWTFAGNFEVPE